MFLSLSAFSIVQFEILLLLFFFLVVSTVIVLGI